MDVTKLSDNDLKALAYDFIAHLEKLQNEHIIAMASPKRSLQIVNDEIHRRRATTPGKLLPQLEQILQKSEE